MSNIYCSKTKGMHKWYILLGDNGVLMKMEGLKKQEFTGEIIDYFQ